MSTPSNIMEGTMKELVERAKQGESEAMGTLIEEYSGRIYAFFYSRHPDRALVEDVVQDTFLKAWENISKLRDANKFVPWLYSIARNCFRDAVGKAYRNIPLDERFVSSEEDPVEDVEREEEMERLLRLLRSLPEAFWMPLWMKEWENLSYEEIAVALRISVGTVRSRIARARRKLRKMWEGEHR